MKMYGLTLVCVVTEDLVLWFERTGEETVVGLIALASLIDASHTLQVFFDSLEEDGGSAIDWQFSKMSSNKMFGYFGELSLLLKTEEEFTSLWIHTTINGRRVGIEFSSDASR